MGLSLWIEEKGAAGRSFWAKKALPGDLVDLVVFRHLVVLILVLKRGKSTFGALFNKLTIFVQIRPMTACGLFWGRFSFIFQLSEKMAFYLVARVICLI